MSRFSMLRVMFISTLALMVAHAPADTTQPAATQPQKSGRDVPSTAMTTLLKAADAGDAATVFDSFDMPEDKDGTARKTLANELLTERVFYRACEARFGHDAPQHLYDRIHILCFPPAHQYQEDEWVTPPGQLGTVVAKQAPRRILTGSFMRRGRDGVWRISNKFPLHEPVEQGLIKIVKKNSAQLAAVTADARAGKYATLDDVIRAISPSSAPPVGGYDTSTLSGAMQAYARAFQDKDPVAMAKFYYAEGDLDGKLAEANARRIVSAMRFIEATAEKLDSAANGLAKKFGLLTDKDAPWWAESVTEHGDRATATLPRDLGEVPFCKVNGVWKLDLTPTPPMTAAQRAKELDHDNHAVEQITADVLAGKFKTLDEVRKALINVRLSTAPPPQP